MGKIFFVVYILSVEQETPERKHEDKRLPARRVRTESELLNSPKTNCQGAESHLKQAR